jgi:hypothetical protein
MRSGAAIMKYDVGAPFFSDPYFGFALTWMISFGLPNSSTTLSLVEQVVEVADDRAKVLARRDRAPAAD